MKDLEVSVDLTILDEPKGIKIKPNENFPEKFSVIINSAKNRDELAFLFSKVMDLIIDRDIDFNLTIAERFQSASTKN